MKKIVRAILSLVLINKPAVSRTLFSERLPVKSLLAKIWIIWTQSSSRTF